MKGKAERGEYTLEKVRTNLGRLAELTDAYLAAVAALERPDPVEMADFLWMASRLLLLKSISRMVVERERAGDFWVMSRTLIRMELTVPMPRIGRSP